MSSIKNRIKTYCQAPNCNDYSRCRGLCNNHYQVLMRRLRKEKEVVK